MYSLVLSPTSCKNFSGPYCTTRYFIYRIIVNYKNTTWFSLDPRSHPFYMLNDIILTRRYLLQADSSNRYKGRESRLDPSWVLLVPQKGCWYMAEILPISISWIWLESRPPTEKTKTVRESTSLALAMLVKKNCMIWMCRNHSSAICKTVVTGITGAQIILVGFNISDI